MRTIWTYHLLLTSLLGMLAHGVLAQQMDVRLDGSTRNYSILKNGVPISDSLFAEVGSFSEGKAYVAKEDLYAYIDTNGKVLCPYAFAVATPFEQGFAIVGDSFYLGVLNHRMQVAVPLRYQRILPAKLGLFRVQNSDGLWGLVDERGQTRLPCIYDLPPIYDFLDYIIVKRASGYGVVNDCGEVLYNTSYQYIGRDGIGYRSGVGLRLFPDHTD